MDYKELQLLRENISQVIVGKEHEIDLVIVALITEGHILLEDLPGTGKTLLSKALAKSIDGIFNRIQFTPDLMPSDVTGFKFYDMKANEFKYQKGPVLSNILLADEINRTIPRTQSSLLESMGEKQVTVDQVTYSLPQPFFVIATQNPIDLEGTYPLPDAQLDRFLFKLQLGNPTIEEEVEILNRFKDKNPLDSLKMVLSIEDINSIIQSVKTIHVADELKEYIVHIIHQTRNHEDLEIGVSTRGSLSLMKAVQGYAAINNRDYIIPDDIKKIAPYTLSHRIKLTRKAKLGGKSPKEVIYSILDHINVSEY